MAEKHFNMVEEYRYSQVESYGVNPPERSKPIWGNENPTEDDLVTSIDYKISLQKLSQKERVILKLFNEGYTLREISECSGFSLPTVQSVKERAIRKMREWLS